MAEAFQNVSRYVDRNVLLSVSGSRCLYVFKIIMEILLRSNEKNCLYFAWPITGGSISYRGLQPGLCYSLVYLLSLQWYATPSLPLLPTSYSATLTLVAQNWLQWEYLHHRNWQTLDIRAFFFFLPCSVEQLCRVKHFPAHHWYKYLLNKQKKNDTLFHLIQPFPTPLWP